MFEYGERSGRGKGRKVIIHLECDWCKKKKKYTKYEFLWVESLKEREKHGWIDRDGNTPDYAGCVSFCCPDCAEKYKQAVEQRRKDRIAKGCKQCVWMSDCYNTNCIGHIPMSEYTLEKYIIEKKNKIGEGSIKVENIMRYWENMLQKKYYIKGEQDSKTTKKVLASRDGCKFAPNICYFDFKENLGEGVYYIDAE